MNILFCRQDHLTNRSVEAASLPKHPVSQQNFMANLKIKFLSKVTTQIKTSEREVGALCPNVILKKKLFHQEEEDLISAMGIEQLKTV